MTHDGDNGEVYLTIKGAVSFFIVSALFISLIGWGVARETSRAQNEDIIEAQIDTCERKKLDRVDNARGWTALEQYYVKIARARSLKSDVKTQIDRLRIRVGESANQLRTRILKCEPLIRDNEYEIDERLLREAQGTL